jgi:hypothetical protein
MFYKLQKKILSFNLSIKLQNQLADLEMQIKWDT